MFHAQFRFSETRNLGTRNNALPHATRSLIQDGGFMKMVFLNSLSRNKQQLGIS